MKKYIIFLACIFSLALSAFTIKNFIGESETTIFSDGIGYYEYLPTIFIQEEEFKNKLRRSDSSINTKLPNMQIPVAYIFVDYKGKKLNKYSIGTALLQSPFFFINYWLELNQNNSKQSKITGYEASFHTAIRYASYFYLFAGLLFFAHFLAAYDINKWVIAMIVILLPISTNVLHYINAEASFSHIYSFFAISGFIFYSKRFFQQHKFNFLLYAAIFFGLILLIRQINLLIIFSLPFLAGSAQNLKATFYTILNHPKYSLSIVFLPLLIFFPQLIAWYMQTGEYLIYSYSGETFNFLDPAFFDILFSYRKGLFVYTPILFLGLLSTIFFYFKKRFFELISWVAFFGLLTYVFSSWWAWWYGCSFGSRAYIEFYPLLFLPLALLINQMNLWSYVSIALAIPTIPLNIIQTYQYENYILHWIDMDKKKYWDVFLKTDSHFGGYVWKTIEPIKDLDQVKTIKRDIVVVPEDEKEKQFIKEKIHITDAASSLKTMEISFKNSFQETDSSKLWITLKKDNQLFYEDRRPLTHFVEKDFNQYHEGKFQYIIRLPNDAEGNLWLEVALIKPQAHKAELVDFKLVAYGVAISEKEIQDMMNYIRNHKEWYEKVKVDAEKKNISIEESLRKHAAWGLENKN